jgi:hypothetical protein
VARPHVNLYEYLREKFAGDPNVQVVLDRRQEEAGAVAQQRSAERRQLGLDQALRARGLAVVVKG